jgi:hypothetical protein
MPVKKSLYETPETWRDSISNTGYNYEGKLLKNNLSREIYKNPVREAMLNQMEPILFAMNEMVKKVKTFADWRKKKDYRKFN